MKTRLCTEKEAVGSAAAHLLDAIKKKPNSVFASSAGEDELCVLRTLSSMARERGVKLEGLRLFSACEFDGLAPEDGRSVRSRIAEALAGSDFRAEKLYTPLAGSCEAYDKAIEDAGGLDIALLGLGLNCRVAFNEPATPYASRCHVQKLTGKTRKEFSSLFGSEEQVPENGVTLGFQELCASRDIVVIARGSERSEAVFQMLYARDDSVFPGAFLQIPLNVTLYADRAAGAKL